MSNASWGPPRPPAGGPPGGPGRGGLRLLIISLSIGLAVLLVATIGLVSWLTNSSADTVARGPVTPGHATNASTTATPTPSASSSAPSPTPTPKASATAPIPKATKPPQPSEPSRPSPDLSLKTNSVYRINLSSGTGTCSVRVRRPKPPLKNSALAPYLGRLVKCLVTNFKAPLAKQGFELTTPKVKTYRGSITTPCGKLRSTANPAYYCAGTIYWPVTSDDGREAYTFARLGYEGLLAHEFGHHIQSMTGILYAYGSRRSTADSQKDIYKLSRRLELQAQCFEGVYLAHVKKSIRLTSRDRSEIRTWHSFTGDEDPPSSRRPDHGTSKAQVRWLERGLAGADFGRCNTWSASSAAVK